MGRGQTDVRSRPLGPVTGHRATNLATISILTTSKLEQLNRQMDFEPSVDCVSVVLDTDLGWDYPDDAFALLLLIRSILRKACSLSLICVTNGVPALSGRKSSIELTNAFLAENGIAVPVVEADPKALVRCFSLSFQALSLKPHVTVVCLGPFTTLVTALEGVDVRTMRLRLQGARTLLSA
jgi:hypothetical protein